MYLLTMVPETEFSNVSPKLVISPKIWYLESIGVDLMNADLTEGDVIMTMSCCLFTRTCLVVVTVLKSVVFVGVNVATIE
jgi:hypothetical protein